MSRTLTVRDVMMETGSLAHPDQGVLEAASRMRELGVPLLPVVDGDTVVGVLSASDILEREPGDDRETDEVSVQSRMTTDLAFCYESDGLATVGEVMRKDGHRFLLVIDRDGYLLGLVGERAVAEALSREPGQAGAHRGASRSHHVETPGRAVNSTPEQPRLYDIRPKVRQ